MMNKIDELKNLFLKGPTLSLRALPNNRSLTGELKNTEIPWAQELLKEFTTDDEDVPQTNTPSLNSQLTLTKKHTPSIDDYLILEGDLCVHYYDLCVRCLTPVALNFETELKACFLSDELSEDPAYEDTDIIYMDQDEYDLYFYGEKGADLLGFLREKLYLEKEVAPLHAEDCKGLCGRCGVNLNLETCEHSGSLSP